MAATCSPCVLPSRSRSNLPALRKPDILPSRLEEKQIVPATPSASSPTSLYAAFKVISLVNGFAKRLKSQTNRKARKVRSKNGHLCRDFLEQQAYAEVDAYLGRCTKRRTKRRHAPRRRSQLHSDPKRVLDSEDVGKALNQIQRAFKRGELPLSTLAQNKNFLRRSSPFHTRRLDIHGLEEVIVVVKDLLDTLHSISPPHCIAYTIQKSEGQLEGPLVHPYETAYNANLIHLLLCLQSQLLRQLIALLVDLLREHIIESQRDRRRFGRDLFFEYPNAKHPLTTTWPWSIKASLAVIWGVCWMFEVAWQDWKIDEEYNLLDPNGQIVLAASDLRAIKREEFELQQKGEVRAPHTGYPRVLASRMSPHHARSHIAQPHVLRTRERPQAATSQSSPQPPYHPCSADQTTPAHLGQHAYPSNTTAYAQEGAAYASADWPFQAPQNFSGHQQASSFSRQGFNNSAYSDNQAVSDTWPLQTTTSQAQHYLHAPQPVVVSSYPQCLPQQEPGRRQISSLRTDFIDGNGYLTPRQDQNYSSPSTLSTTSGVAQQDLPSQFTFARNYYGAPESYHPANGNMAEVQQQPMHPEPGMAMSPASVAPEPPQPTSRGPSPMSDGMQGKKRSFSEMNQLHTQSQSQTQQAVEPSPQNSGYGTSPIGEEEGSHRVHRAFKRETAPMNSDNKYYCTVSDKCSHFLFDRKCEWSKHMDKHDRPYMCGEKECAKLQGFTYSGGLLRHEREVHGKHGGPKEQLRCTQPGCKRQTGKGFTRKENLNEHLRRVHGINILNADADPNTPMLKQIAADAAPGAETDLPPNPYLQGSAPEIDPFNFTPEAVTKKRRVDDGTSGGVQHQRSVSEDVETELQRLRTENEDKDERIRRLQEADEEKEERLRKLEAALDMSRSSNINPELSQQTEMPRAPAPPAEMRQPEIPELEQP